MSERREFNASSLDEAIEKAAVALDVERENLSYETLDNGSSGFLGIGARDARILVEISASGGNTQEDESYVEEPAQEVPHSPSEDEGSSQEHGQHGDAPETMGVSDHPSEQPESSDEPEVISGELLEDMRAHVETMLDAMAFEGEVSIRDDGEVIVVEIESEDAGLLIGQKGETIDALQYLVNASFYKEHRLSKRVLLDCGGYRERRIKAVQGMAHRTAKRVSRERIAIDLPHMSPSERRAVHSYLKDNPNVTTASTGNDESRRIIISPA